MEHYVFIIAYKSPRPVNPLGTEIFKELTNKGMWVVHQNTQYRDRVQEGDRVLFYLAGEQVFLGAAEIAAKAVPANDIWLSPYMLRKPYKFALQKLQIFNKVVLRKELFGVNDLARRRQNRLNPTVLPMWMPTQGGCNRISLKDYKKVLLKGTK